MLVFNTNLHHPTSPNDMFHCESLDHRLLEGLEQLASGGSGGRTGNGTKPLPASPRSEDSPVQPVF